MPQGSKDKDRADSLRQAAESRVLRNLKKIPHMTAEEISRLVFDLQTHQIELEMQQQELLQAQLDLEDSRDKYTDLYDFAPVGYLTTNTNGLITDSNLTVSEMLGQTKDRLLRQPLSAFVIPDDQDLYYTHFRSLKKSDKRITCSLRIKPHKGDVFWADLDTIKVQSKVDGETQFRTALSDVSERYKNQEDKSALEQQLHHAQKLKSLGILAGGMAHNFNNLLVPILGYAELVHSMVPPGSKEARYLTIVENSVLKAKSLVEEILVFGQKEIFNSQVTQLKDLVIEALALLKPSIAKRITIHEEYDNNLDPIAADPGQVHQVIVNLCLNAVQAISGPGSIWIKLEHLPFHEFISAGGKHAQGPFLRLSVQDSGSGIDKDDLDHIFDPFFSTRKGSDGGGTGLGLSTVARIVEQHQGHIQVESQVGRGTNFLLYFPYIEAKPEPESKPVPASSSPGGTILFIEDDDMVHETGTAFLDHLGYQVISFGDPLEALSEFQRNPGQFSLVLTDYTMPGIDGAEVARRVKAIRADLPVLLSTGYSNLATEKNLALWGCDGIIKKPFAMTELQEYIQKLISPDPESD